MKGRICLECIHCSVFGGSPEYSELTPEIPFQFTCNKVGVNFLGDSYSKTSLIKELDRAETCPKFEPDERVPQ